MSQNLVPLTDNRIREMLVKRAAARPDERLLSDISRAVAATPQLRPGLARWRPRALAMAGLAAVVVAAVIGVSRLVPPPGVGPGVQPSPTASPAPTARAMLAAGLDAVPLEAGRWRTRTFEPEVTFTVQPDTWAPARDIRAQVQLRAWLPGAPDDEVDALTLVRLDNRYRDPCDGGLAGGTELWPAGTTPADVFAWLDGHWVEPLPAPQPVMVAGYEGLEIETTMPEFAECVEGYLPITDVGEGAISSGLPEQRWRYAVIDVDGDLLLLATWAFDDARWPAVRAAADEVLGSLEFGP